MGLIVPTEVHRVDNGAGWSLELRVYRDRDRLVAGRRPVVMIPGYAMNSYILGYHPGGPSMVAWLVQEGFEVWTANLRGQGGSLPPPRPSRFGLAELALDDLPVVFAHVLAHTATGAHRLDPVGCSLGASLLYAYLAHHPEDHPFGAAVAIGGPFRWETVHPLLRAAFVSARVAGAVPIRGTRRLARAALPLLVRVPRLLSVYMNADGIDLSKAAELVPTVDDPVPWINRQVARWVQQRDLVVRGVDVTDALARVADLRLLVILANADGIVTPEAARSVVPVLGADRVDVFEIGTPERWYAHADLFIGRRAQDEVFVPLATWLAEA
ncbi:MAG: alpha/beta fold hydrolase [Alphaproteobacteria bacterium]|nr:alpha/beta fold hydrolase [Alphaproteobacteria bacterium]